MSDWLGGWNLDAKERGMQTQRCEKCGEMWWDAHACGLRVTVAMQAQRPEPPPERTVADIPDEELLRRVVLNVTRKRPRRKEFAWSEVMAAFGLGSTYAAQLCRRFGIDPDTGAEQK